MDRLEELLHRVREPRKCAELLLGAPDAVAVAVAQQPAAVLFSLPGSRTMQTILHIIQLAVAGFVAWGGWLCFSAWVRELRAGRADTGSRALARADGFERAASLVLLALLCTTLVAVA